MQTPGHLVCLGYCRCCWTCVPSDSRDPESIYSNIVSQFASEAELLKLRPAKPSWQLTRRQEASPFCRHLEAGDEWRERSLWALRAANSLIGFSGLIPSLVVRAGNQFMSQSGSRANAGSPDSLAARTPMIHLHKSIIGYHTLMRTL